MQLSWKVCEVGITHCIVNGCSILAKSITCCYMTLQVLKSPLEDVLQIFYVLLHILLNQDTISENVIKVHVHNETFVAEIDLLC